MAKRPSRDGGVVRLVIEAVAEIGQLGMEQGEEFLVGQAAPLVAVESLVPGAADAALDEAGILHARENGGDKIGQFDPAISGGEDVWRILETAPDLGPEPLGGVGVAALGNVLGAVLGGEAGDLGRFLVAGMVFPEPALRREMLPPGGIERERNVFEIDRNGAGAGGIDANADDLAGRKAGFLPGLFQGALDALLQADDVIGGILPGEIVVVLVEQDALVPARVIEDRCAQFLARGAIDDEGPDRIGAVINTESREHGNEYGKLLRLQKQHFP